MLKFQYSIEEESMFKRVFFKIAPFALGLSVGMFGMFVLQNNVIESSFAKNLVSNWTEDLAEQRQDVATAKQKVEAEVEALSVKMAQMQARLVRLDSLGERIVDLAKLDEKEFTFGPAISLGGAELDEETQAFVQPSFTDILDNVNREIIDKEERLKVLQNILDKERWHEAVKLAGHPIESGYISSRFGYRSNPFHGGLDHHAGIDFAATIGTPIYATGPGIVSLARVKGGYGNAIEITHADGKVTRYGHCSKLLVTEGTLVKAGDLIAEVGNTGNSTGPHVHYEVIIDGHRVDPAPYLKQASEAERKLIALNIGQANVDAAISQ